MTLDQKTFNLRLALCWTVTASFTVAAFCFAMSPPQGGLVNALCSAVFVIVHGLTWYQLVISTRSDQLKKPEATASIELTS